MENDNQVNEPVSGYGQPTDFQQVWQLFIETDKKFKETDKKINKLSELFTSQWGKLIESLVEGDLVKLLKTRGITVESVNQRRKGSKKGVNFEYDLIAINTDEIVIVEVKTTLRPQDVEDFHKKLWKAKTFMPEYKHMRIYGAVAYITVHGSSDSMAENLGFFTIRATGSSSSIVNDENFKPKAF
jgi:Holliday junction resolvase